MRVIKDKFGCLNPYSEVLAARSDCTVIENYEATARVVPKKAAPKKTKPKAIDPKPATGADALGVLDGMDPE